MADLYGSVPSSGSEPEEFSNFFNQILQNSSSPSFSASRTKFGHTFSPVNRTDSDVNLSDFNGDLVDKDDDDDDDDVKEKSNENTFSNTCSKRRGVPLDTDFSCDSERVAEASNHVRPRSSSKRTRAAEVHNLSEKRRRSRINEKMKALQNLIPNSNKTDKASMLDEAIEYLKQLQLQVQMLSLRNGLSLHPLCLPGVLQPMQLPSGMSFAEGNGMLTAGTGTITLSANAESLTPTAFSYNLCSISNQQVVVPPMSNMTTETSFGFEPSIQANYGLYNVPPSSKEICKEGTTELQLDTNHTGRNSSSGVS